MATRKRVKIGLPPYVRIIRDRVAEREYLAGLPSRKIKSPSDIVAAVGHIRDERQEVFLVLTLNVRANIVGIHEVTRGLVDSSMVHPREVFTRAIGDNAAAIVMAHNHPSGDPTPSDEDRAVTRQMVAAGNLLGIPVYDHVVLGDEDRYVSFASAGLI